MLNLLKKQQRPTPLDQIREHHTQQINQKLQTQTTNTLSQLDYIIQNATPHDIQKLHKAVQKATKTRNQ